MIEVWRSVVEQTSHNHSYTWHDVTSVTSASTAAVHTEYSRAHHTMRRNHCLSVSFDLAKKLFVRMERVVLQEVHLILLALFHAHAFDCCIYVTPITDHD